MKTSSLLVVVVVRAVAFLALLGTVATCFAQAQVSFLQPDIINGASVNVAADFNRDGKLDIATPSTLVLGNGDGTFKPPINLSVSGNLVATADFNNDGNPDLVIANSVNSTVIYVLLGNGDGTFQAVKSTNVGISFAQIVVADVNGDGKPDLLGLVQAGQVFVFLGNGDGTFKPGVPYAAGPYPYQMVTGDFYGDGKLDIATTNGASVAEIAVMRGNGNGTFQAPVISAGVQSPLDVIATDINGDGKLDLIVADGSTFQTYTFLGNGNGTFQAGIVVAPVAGNLGLGDLNRDGKADLVIQGTTDIAQIFLGNGNGTFNYSHAYVASGEILIADFRNDGKFDLLIGDTLLLGNGDGTFNGQPVVPLPGGDAAVVGDFNGDGNPDIAVTSVNNLSDVYILLGDGKGALTLEHTYTLAAPGQAIAAGDLNGDGKQDLVVFTTDSSNWSLDVLLGNGDGTFGAPTVYPQGQNNLSGNAIPQVAIADFRGDKKPYVATLQGDSFVMFPNNGDGTLGTPVSYFAGSQVNGFVVADFNNDGKLDVAVTSSAGIAILRGNGDGTFQPATFITIQGTAFDILTGDFNNDGNADLIVFGQVFLGDGDGTFTAGPAVQPGGVWTGVADFNGDGNLDLVGRSCYGSTAQFELWCVSLGNGDGTFGSPIDIMDNMGITPFFQFVVVADFNRDQKPDIAIEVTEGAGLSPLFMLLDTTPSAPGVMVSPATVTFPSQATGTSSSPVGVTLNNRGKGVLTVSKVAFTGANAIEFGQTNNCATVQPGASCTINVTFTPTVAGNATANLSITDNAVGSPQVVSLSGVATSLDMGLKVSSGGSSQTVTAGSTATYSLSIGGKGWSGQTSLTCSGAPAAATCSVTPSSLIVSATSASQVNVSVKTTSNSMAAVSPRNLRLVPWLWAMAFMGMVVLPRSVRTRLLTVGLLLSSFTLLLLVSCGGGNSSHISNNGTPPGSYTLTVAAKAASGSSSHVSLTLTVQ